MPGLYVHDHLETKLDWEGKLEELQRMEDTIDEIDHEVMYLDDYPDDVLNDDVPDDVPDDVLEETKSVSTLVYDRLGATPASTTVSTDMEAASDMLNLSMGPPELLASCIKYGKPTTPAETDSTLSDDEQFGDMFKIHPKVPACRDPMSPKAGRLKIQALMAEAQYKYAQRTQPPPSELRMPKDDKDTWNVVLRVIQTPKVADILVNVADPRNKDPLDLDWDANCDATLKHMQDWHRRESCSSSAGSWSTSGKHHRSVSCSWDQN